MKLIRARLLGSLIQDAPYTEWYHSLAVRHCADNTLTQLAVNAGDPDGRLGQSQ